jgi:hypothetical protein
MANRTVIADVAWSGCQIAPMKPSIAQEQMVTQSQYLIEPGVLQQTFFRARIEFQITASSSSPTSLYARRHLAPSARSPLAAWPCRAIPKLAHELVSKNLPLMLEPNRVPERLLYLTPATKSCATARLSEQLFSRRVFMSATPYPSKLAELRVKTDQDLVRIIDNALEVGLLLAANEADGDPWGVLHRRAADIYADAVMLVERVENVREHRRLEEKLRQLRESLEQRRARVECA